jgi:hypothetical protein
LKKGVISVRPASFRPLNPFFSRRIDRSGKKKTTLRVIGGWPYETTFHDILRAGLVAATPLTIARLERVADAIDFPRDEIFLDGATR